MLFSRMPLEEWFDKYQYEIKFDIGESAVKYYNLGQLQIDLGAVPLRYGYHCGRPDLRAKIAEGYPGLSGDNVLVTNGGAEANFSIVSALAAPGDHVIVEHPNFAPLYEVPRKLGCEVTFLKLRFEDRFEPDLERLEHLITPRTRLITFTHPNNPTGSMISCEMLKRLVRIAESRGIYLLFDETYRDLTFGDPLPAAATLSPKVISLSSMSKCYGLPGIRIGWLATRCRKVIDAVLAIREHVTITNSALSEEIAFQVLKQKDVFLKRSRSHALKNLEIVRNWMKNQPDMEWVPPAAGVVALPRLRFARDEGQADELYRVLAEKYKTFVIPGRCFEVDNRFFRLGYGGMPDEILSGLENLRVAANELRLNAPEVLAQTS
jgi:aspartate/methionine/tyrosine aminotransferase